MQRLLLRVATVAFLCVSVPGVLAQLPGFPQMAGEKVAGSVAVDRALKASSLTFDGKPFHAVLEIGNAGAAYSGTVEVWWKDATTYRLTLTSPKFRQTKIVNGSQIQETDEGDYYPRWLESFALALIDPLPVANNFRGGGEVTLGAQITRSCLRRDDRPGGITDQMTWGDVCFSGSEPRLSSVMTFNVNLEFSDWKSFGKKQIARTYKTDVLAFQEIVGRLTKLEELKQADDSMFTVNQATSADQRIKTTLVSTAREESLLESAPTIEWPTVREGKTDGYMIVYARTDRTGQVREIAKHNSDQPGLEDFGMQQALKYKFKPLIVDGVAEQMEMPLVLRFTSRLADPLPVLSVGDMKKQMGSCQVPDASGSKGTMVTMRVAVNEAGKMAGMSATGVGKGTDWVAAMRKLEGLRACQFTPYLVDGKPSYYKGDIEVTVP